MNSRVWVNSVNLTFHLSRPNDDSLYEMVLSERINKGTVVVSAVYATTCLTDARERMTRIDG